MPRLVGQVLGTVLGLVPCLVGQVLLIGVMGIVLLGILDIIFVDHRIGILK